MTTQSVRLKIARLSVFKAKTDVRFPANVSVDNFLTVLRSDGTYQFGVDYDLVGEAPIVDPSTAMVVVLDRASETYKLQSISSLLASATQVVQEVTTGGPVPVLPNAGIVKVNQTVGAPITLNMPLASIKTCPVKIVDWKGDAATNNITIALSGSDKFQANLASWVLAANGASVNLDPISGAGYVI